MISRRFFLAATTGFALTPEFVAASDEVPVMLDHILLGCSDLDRGIDFVEKHTGVRAAFGGVHPGRGTRNALLSLGEKHYLEIIAPDPQQSGAPDHYGLSKLTEPRLVGWAAHPGDLSQFATRLRNAGLAFDGPTPGSRKRPDGRLLQWKTLNLKEDREGMLPFFIEWSVDTVHPSADAPLGCNIFGFGLVAPDNSELANLCKLLELDVSVIHGAPSEFFANIFGSPGHVLALKSKPTGWLVTPT
ncbi:MAG TPA: VOC family protein [Candidatus Acidoferrum sp.]|nr:VOC family protein [Candidatus Acidoferrum sp.]